MKSKVIAAKSFERPAKKLAKRYPSFPRDLLNLIAELEGDPLLGTPLGGNLRKIRMAIRSKGKGKSSGARVISLVYLAKHSVHLLTVYDKSDAGTISDDDLDRLAEEVRKSNENDL